VATRLDGQHQDRPLPHTVRYSVGDNRIGTFSSPAAPASDWGDWLPRGPAGLSTSSPRLYSS
jgi:hypothetical protein